MRSYRTKIEFMQALEKELERAGVSDKGEILTDFVQHFTDGTQSGISEAAVCEKLGDVREIAAQYADEAVASSVSAPPVPELPSLPDLPQVELPPPPELPPVTIAETTEATELILDIPTESTLTLGEMPEAAEIEQLIQAAPAYDESLKSKSWQTAEEQPSDQTQAPPASRNDPPPTHSYSSSGTELNIGGLIGALIVDAMVLSWAIPALFSVFLGLLAVPFSLVVSGVAMTVGGFIELFGDFAFISIPFAPITTIFLGLMALSAGGLLSLAGVQLVKLAIRIVKGIVNWHGRMIVGRPVFTKKLKNA